MRIISETDLARTPEFEGERHELPEFRLNDASFKELLEQMDNPLNVQKEIMAKCKFLLDRQMEQDLELLGKLSTDTRRWINEFNNTLTNLQKSMHGDKSTVEIKISHAHISQKIREVGKIVDIKA